MKMMRWFAAAGCLALTLAVSAQKKSATPKDTSPGTTYEPVYPPENNNYPLTEESKYQPGVPKGVEFKFTLNDSKIFPDTSQTITVYVPAEYTPDKPAALWVELDGLKPPMAPTFDNLLAKKQIPVLIAVGISPGTVKAAMGDDEKRLQRSYEFDGQSDRFARFVMQEVIPAVEAQKTPSGQAIRISSDPNDHAISGGSTGGIGAFTAAFLRPDYFRRVFTTIGTFVGMRGGEQEYVTVRKTEPRPLRIFMMDGANDEWGGGPEMGDWHMANLTMERALTFAGYDVKHIWGQGTHNGALGMQVFPDVLRWLWRDYPAPIVARAPGNPRLAELLLPGEDWVAAGTGSLPMAISADGKKYEALKDGGFSNGGKALAKDLHIRGLVVRANGDVYATADNSGGTLWRITPDGKETRLYEGIRGATGLAFLPDGYWLMVGQANGQHILDMRVQKDGAVDAVEPMYQVAMPPTADDAATGQLAFDTQGWLYAATRMGVQVFDRNGRVTGILPAPGAEAVTGLTFDVTDPHTLLISTASGKLYKRKVKVTGWPQSGSPIKLPQAGAG